MSNGLHHGIDQPSAWVQQWSTRIPAAGRVLDVACGSGRHARYLAGHGLRVEAVDRDAAALNGLAGVAGVTTRVADLEGAAWPYTGQHFDAVVVTNYLHRPLFPHLLAVLAPGGVLIYETFTQGNETVGKPSRPDFLLRPGELLEVCQGLRVVAFEEGFRENPPRFVQRIAAVREPAATAGLPAPPRYLLT